MYFYGKSKNYLEESRKSQGPRLVMDLMDVGSCVPRVHWNVFCCVEGKIIVIIGHFPFAPHSPV